MEQIDMFYKIPQQFAPGPDGIKYKIIIKPLIQIINAIYKKR